VTPRRWLGLRDLVAGVVLLGVSLGLGRSAAFGGATGVDLVFDLLAIGWIAVGVWRLVRPS
jgi:hypothetical protein